MTTDFSALSPLGSMGSNDGIAVADMTTGALSGAIVKADLIADMASGIFTASTPASKRWRIRFPFGAEGSAYGVGLSELQFLISGSNQCSGGTPFASGTDGSWSLAAAFDGTLNSGGWYGSSTHAGGINIFIGYEFATAITPDAFKWCPLHGFGNGQTDPSDIVVEFQNANGTWVPVAEVLVTTSTQDTLSSSITIPSTFEYVPAPTSVTDGLYPFYGQEVGVCGDSISSASYGGLTWPDEMAAMLHCIVHNVAVSGNVMRDAVTQMGGLTLASNSVLLVFLGTNDYGNGSGTVYGTLGDTSASNTFYGDIDYVINTALAGNEAIALGFIITPHRYDVTAANSRSKVLTDYNQAVKDVCAKYSIPYLDLYAESGVNATTETTLLGDQLHPSALGRHIYARKIAAFVRTL